MMICKGAPYLCSPLAELTEHWGCRGCWIYLSCSRTPLKSHWLQCRAQQIKMPKVLFLQSLQPSLSPHRLWWCSALHGMESHSRRVSLWKRVILKVMEKGPSNHINRAETRPNLFEKAKEDRAMPCVGLSVASDLNLVVWSLFISHLVGGITISKLWQFTSFAACFQCFALFG